ncbi:DUF4233 domain-containing protein [Occultella gossypii]|uniref:DUF4233 domain-containing protein n=1 Tax=Occultella gossypii TaxID=2800820 RepID=UPI001CC0C023|nr:DUF4233 domain-containing protein [Occultella gossypii]
MTTPPNPEPEARRAGEASSAVEGSAPVRPARRPQRSARLIFCLTVLSLEVFVVFFATLVAFGLELSEPGVTWVVGGVGMLLCIVAAYLQKYPIALVAGYVVQALLLLSGILVPMMLVIGIVFAAIWVTGVWLGGKIDAERLERLRAERAAAAS